jgi:hypothetical protein
MRQDTTEDVDWLEQGNTHGWGTVTPESMLQLPRSWSNYCTHAQSRVTHPLGGIGHTSHGDNLRRYSALHNKPELPFLVELVCVTLFGPKMEIQPLCQKTLNTTKASYCKYVTEFSRNTYRSHLIVRNFNSGMNAPFIHSRAQSRLWFPLNLSLQWIQSIH